MSTTKTVPSAHSGATNKIVTARDAVRLIRSGNTVAIGGFGGIGLPEDLLDELAALHRASDQEAAAFGKPSGLTLVFGGGPGDGQQRGAQQFGQPGFIKRIVGGHWAYVPALYQLVLAGQAEGYNLPLGVITQLYRDIAAGKPGHASRVGLGTFVDPRFGGGKLNSITTEDLVEVINIGGKEYLFYKTFPIDVALIRATTADVNGNLTMEREALTSDTLSVAMAAHNSGGLVIAQVERIADAGSLNPRLVKVPGALVDCVVVASRPEVHQQTGATMYNPAYSSEVRIPLTSMEPMPMSARKIIARRAAMELRPNSIVNLGIGMPEGVAVVAAEEKASDLMTLTAEPGVIGGVPAGGLNFGAGVNAQAVIDMPYQFDFYDGGGLDVTFLGLAQADREGNLNVSRFGPKLAGAGGFINISQNAKKVVFCGTFTAGDLDVSVVQGKLLIERDGRAKKFVEAVEERTFSGKHAAELDKDVLYITERCVFRLTREGLELTEVAPGIDLQRDILDRMDFAPIVRAPRQMDPRIFAHEPMGLRDEMLRIPFDARFAYDEERNTLFLNFSEESVKSQATIDRYCDKIRSIVEPLGHKVYAVINYDGWEIDRSLEDAYLDVVKKISDQYYLGVTRFTTSAFMRAKLGDQLAARGVAPHIFESEAEAKDAVRETVSRTA
ncbi:acyl CoA:acetate/3-ketoacid CoA transferase [Ottowia sp.]|jgi:propionate CoA-transferase|uniref:acyl CoA:acetate/3-ketoacid CoA transferase n=1 Tax=Ottowia sp. TaxID=1898956 RepID=UPI00260035D5|nr:acyl CoA:acetate/3-ketoacid CoA transferase [Ottowia sp.]MBK6614186.1 acyl CoA:acetate/3-ketoacid CoA transferase [Ottowia sp.]